MKRERLIVLLTPLLAGCTLFGVRSGYEQPAYEIVDTVGAVEIRSYGPRLVAQTIVSSDDEMSARNAAFRILAAYIFGDNVAKDDIAMTTPVAVEQQATTIDMTTPVETAAVDGNRYAMRFFLPSSLTLETAPAPTDPRVQLAVVPANTLAVLRFSGSRRPSAVAEKSEKLLGVLADSKWQTVGRPFTLFYDPPWTLSFLRRNEVAVSVEPRS
ncbi:MAG TPA: heme-binding protein [Candidatus Binatia bacterium]|nr:heme-binding protein [Candidatus Binatia bacterium]